jgi:hypothetical protein
MRYATKSQELESMEGCFMRSGVKLPNIALGGHIDLHPAFGGDL